MGVMKKLAILLALLLLPVFALGQTGAYSGHTFAGGVPATTSGMNSSNYLDGIIPGAAVTVYLTGTSTKATIYADRSNTPLSNPFFSNLAAGKNPGGFIFWAAQNQGLDIQAQGGMGNASCTTSPLCYPMATTLQTYVFPTSGGSPGGSNGQVQYNSSGVFAGYGAVPVAQGGTNAVELNAAMTNLGFTEQNVVTPYTIPSAAVNLPSWLSGSPQNGLAGILWFANGCYVMPFASFGVPESDHSNNVYCEWRNRWSGWGVNPDTSISPPYPMLGTGATATITSVDGNGAITGITVTGGVGLTGPVGENLFIWDRATGNTSAIVTVASLSSSTCGTGSYTSYCTGPIATVTIFSGGSGYNTSDNASLYVSDWHYMKALASDQVTSPNGGFIIFANGEMAWAGDIAGQDLYFQRSKNNGLVLGTANQIYPSQIDGLGPQFGQFTGNLIASHVLQLNSAPTPGSITGMVCAANGGSTCSIVGAPDAALVAVNATTGDGVAIGSNSTSHVGEVRAIKVNQLAISGFTSTGGTNPTLTFTTSTQSPPLIAGNTVTLVQFPPGVNAPLNTQTVTISASGLDTTHFEATVTGAGFTSATGQAISSVASSYPLSLNGATGSQVGVAVPTGNSFLGIFDVHVADAAGGFTGANFVVQSSGTGTGISGTTPYPIIGGYPDAGGTPVQIGFYASIFSVKRAAHTDTVSTYWDGAHMATGAFTDDTDATFEQYNLAGTVGYTGTGTAPTVSSNAGTGSLTHGTDNTGIIATGATSTATTLTFNLGWSSWASCTVTASTATALPYVSAISKSSVTFTYVTTGTPTLYYNCNGN